MKTTILSVLFLFLLGCSEDDATYSPQPIIPISISHYSLPGVTQSVAQQNLVVAEDSVWVTLKQSMSTRLEHFSETEINFDEFIVLAVFDQIYPNGGHSIDITSVVEHETNITVTLERLLTGDMTAVIMQPYHIVKIPKTSKPVLFEMSFN